MDAADASARERRHPPAGFPPARDWWLLRVHAVLLWHAVGSLRGKSKLMMGVIVLFLAAYLAVAAWVFHEAIMFAERSFLGVGALLIDRMFFMLFAFVGLMLALSSLVLGYANAFRSSETEWLHTLPLEPERIFRWKCLETGILASWASIFLVTPLLVTFGRLKGAPLSFYPLSLAVLVPFLGLMSLAGCLLGLGIAVLLRHRGFRVALGAAAAASVLGLMVRLRPMEADSMASGSILPLLDHLLQQTRFVHAAWLPSSWVSRAILGLSEDAGQLARFYGLLLLSWFLAAVNLVWWISRLAYRLVWQRVQEGRAHAVRPRRARTGGLAGWPSGARVALRWLPLRRGLRALMWKDVVSFWRDPAQWMQAGLFFGLLAFYILNLRNVRTDLDQLFWVCLVGYLNLVSVGMILAAMLTRFVFPQFSLEGRRMWILGLAPVSLPSLMRGKFWLSSLTAAVVTVALMGLSSTVLRGGRWLVVMTTATALVMSFSLTGLAIGLGILYPTIGRSSHYRGVEDNPARVVSGFGGTFCLVISMLYVFGVGAMEGFGMYRCMQAGGALAEPVFFVAIVGMVVGTSLLVGWVPMRLAEEKLSRFEI